MFSTLLLNMFLNVFCLEFLSWWISLIIDKIRHPSQHAKVTRAIRRGIYRYLPNDNDQRINYSTNYMIMFSKTGKWGECKAYFNILRDGVLNRRPKGLETREPAENQMADYYDMLLKERLPLGKGRRSTVPTEGVYFDTWKGLVVLL